MTPRDPQSECLQAWRHEPPDTPRFNAEVWSRIESQRRASAPSLFYRWALPLAACLAIIAGIGTAKTQADAQYTQHMAASLVRSVDPLQMASHSLHP